MNSNGSNSLNHLEHPTVSSLFLCRLQAMDAEGWNRLVHIFGPIVYGWCRQSGVSEQDTADIVQQVFASVARGILKFHPQKEEGSFRSWLATITRNCVRDHFRRRSREVASTGGSDAQLLLQQLEESLDSTICSNSARGAMVRRILEEVRVEFEATTWQAFWLTTVEGQTAAEVSAATGLSTASVYQAKSRILRRLRHLLTDISDLSGLTLGNVDRPN